MKRLNQRSHESTAFDSGYRAGHLTLSQVLASHEWSPAGCSRMCGVGEGDSVSGRGLAHAIPAVRGQDPTIENDLLQFGFQLKRRFRRCPRTFILLAL